MITASHCRRAWGIVLIFSAIWISLSSRPVWSQSFGVELHNTLMPAAGGMAGASIALPQDLTSAINGNPAALTQFSGTQFLFGGAWVEPTFNLRQTAALPLLGVDPFDAKSTAPGMPAGNIGVTQDFSSLGLPMTLGLGFVTSAGGIVDFRDTPASNGTNSDLVVFSLPMSVGLQVTDRMSVGATLAMGIAFFDPPFAAIGGMTPDYALRGTIGANYDITDCTTIGAYYQTEQSFQFNDAIRFPAVDPPGVFRTVNADLPQNIGIGVANRALADGCLLLAVDLVYKLYDDARLFGAVYNNQFVAQFGAQYTMNQYHLRAGYAWAENPLDPTPGSDLGGVISPGGIPAVRYTQALLAVTSRHRISAGIGVSDVLPGLDMDLMAGGMFRDTEQLGPSTTTSIAGYWIGFGLTWRFGSDNCNSCSAASNPWANGGG